MHFGKLLGTNVETAKVRIRYLHFSGGGTCVGGGNSNIKLWSRCGSLEAASQILLRAAFLPGPSRGTAEMVKYKILVVTGDSLFAGSTNPVQLWLVGEHGEADLGKQLRPLLGKVSAGHWVGSQRLGTWGLWGGEEA